MASGGLRLLELTKPHEPTCSNLPPAAPLRHAQPQRWPQPHFRSSSAALCVLPRFLLFLLLYPSISIFAANALTTNAASASSASLSARVVVVNDIAGHFEVLAGVLTSLHRLLAPHPSSSSSASLQPANNQTSGTQHRRQQLQLQLQQQGTAPRPRVVFTGNARGPALNGLLDWLGPEVASWASWHPLTGSGGSGGEGEGGGLGGGSAAGGGGGAGGAANRGRGGGRRKAGGGGG
ncbi:hypothetical protein Agub_g2719, partial [Astrephomene gubernaculifera]